MAILIQKKKTKILSAYDSLLKYGGEVVYGGQSSRIINISTLRKDKNSIKRTGQNIQGQDGLEEEIFTYEVFFRIDMRKALELNIDSLDFSITSGPTISRLGSFVPEKVRDGSPKRVIEGIFKGNRESIRMLKVDKLNKVIGEGKIDLNQYINQVKNKDMRLSDELMFGRVKSLTLQKVVDKKYTEKEKKALAFQPQDFYKDNDSAEQDISQDFSLEYIRMIEKGVDPAQAFFPSPPFSRSISGVTRDIHSLYPAAMRKERIDLIRNMFLFSNSGSPSLFADIRNTNISEKIVAYETFVFDRYKVVKLSFDLAGESVSNLSDILCQIKVRDPEMGTVTEKLDITVPHAVHVENYYIPDFLPKISLFRNDKEVGDSCVDATFCHVQSEKIKTIKARIRKIKDDAPVGHATYGSKSRTFEDSEIDAVKRQNTYRLKKASSISSFEMLVGRPFVLTPNNILISNIQNSSVEVGDSFDYLYSGMDLDRIPEGFKVNYYVKSPRASGVTIHRKMSSENSFTPINQTLESSIGRERESVPLNPGKHTSQTCGYSEGSSFKDRLGQSPNRERVFHYRKKIFLKSGGYVWDKKIITAMRRKSLGIVNININNVNSPANRDIASPAKSLSNVSFEISGKLKSTNTDIILDILREEEKAEIFEDVIQSTRTSLSDILVFGVTRTNITTSSVEFLGYYKKGKFVDDGKRSLSKPSLGNKYKYTVTAYLINPEMIEKYFNLSVSYNKNVITKTNQIMMPSFIQKVQNVAVRDTPSNVGTRAVNTNNIGAFENLKIQKYYSGKQMEVGNIRTNQDYSQDYNFENFSTGDYTDTYVDLTKSHFIINAQPKNSISRSYSGCPVIRFSIDGDVSHVDFLVMTCIRNGIEKIIGTCMPSQSGDIVFVDYASSKFVGQVEYYAAAITLSGQLSEKTLVGNSVLLQAAPSNINSAGSARGY